MCAATTTDTDLPKPLYPIPMHALRTMVLALPRPDPDDPDAAWQDAVQDSLDKVAALDPRDAIEAMLAIDLVALNAAKLNALRLAVEPAATADQARLQRASAVALHRSFTNAARMLDRQRRLPAAPERDWNNAAADLAAMWRTAPSRPLAAIGAATARGAIPKTVVRWIDEIDDAELQIAIEQQRRQNAGEPPLPMQPGEPIVLYRYKPNDYIHKFKPDPKNFRPYPGWENMTMAERREFFGYTYTGPNGPPEALTPASRDAMIKQMAEEEELRAKQMAEEELLKAEYGI